MVLRRVINGWAFNLRRIAGREEADIDGILLAMEIVNMRTFQSAFFKIRIEHMDVDECLQWFFDTIDRHSGIGLAHITHLHEITSLDNHLCLVSQRSGNAGMGIDTHEHAHIIKHLAMVNEFHHEGIHAILNAAVHHITCYVSQQDTCSRHLEHSPLIAQSSYARMLLSLKDIVVFNPNRTGNVAVEVLVDRIQNGEVAFFQRCHIGIRDIEVLTVNGYVYSLNSRCTCVAYSHVDG